MTLVGIGTDLLVSSAIDEPIEDGVLIVDDGRIVWSGPLSELPGFPCVWSSWHPPVLAPALIDAHTHLSIETPGREFEQLEAPDAVIATRAARFASEIVRSGVGGVRLLGEPGDLSTQFADAAEHDPHGWPSIVSCGRGIRPSHAIVSVADIVVDTEDDARRGVELVASSGADWLKLHATPSSLRGDPIEPLFSASLLRLLIELGHDAKMRIAVHCHGGPAADICIDAGVDTIEHGRFLSDEQLKRMADSGTTLVSTVGIGAIARHRQSGEPLLALLSELAEPVRRAKRAGVQVIPGSDAIHGRFSLELHALELAGFTPKEVFTQSTR
ncbi:MAG: amidohydrolase family protein, partial [Thermomicrobiales bacterium]|nr:amidohydrolase family protein [Thermomicrobiales bacterium]